MQQVSPSGAHTRRELRQNAVPFVQPHLLNDVRALVGGKTFENRRDAGWFQLFENRSATTHRGLVAEFDAALERQHRDDRGSFVDSKLIEQFREIFGRQISNLATDSDKTFVQSKLDAFE
jgi:hypothetical protein